MLKKTLILTITLISLYLVTSLASSPSNGLDGFERHDGALLNLGDDPYADF